MAKAAGGPCLGSVVVGGARPSGTEVLERDRRTSRGWAEVDERE